MTDTKILREKISQLVAEYAEQALAAKPFVPGQTVVPPSGKLIGAEELQMMVEASLDGWLTTGRFNDEFERKLAEFYGVKYLITVNSGSSANLVAFSTLTSPKLGERAIRPGDEVIGVAAGFPTTVNPIIQFGAIPVFVDVELGTYNIDASKIEAAISSKTKAIMLAHTLGNPYNLEVISALCKKYNLWLVEDCCDALGSTYDGKMVGTFGDIGTVSFYPAHHITMGEGGAVFTNNEELKKIAESFAIGAVIAIAHQAATIPVASVSARNWAAYRKATITSTLIAILVTTSRSRTCKRPAVWHSWPRLLSLYKSARTTSPTSRLAFVAVKSSSFCQRLLKSLILPGLAFRSRFVKMHQFLAWNYCSTLINIA